MKKSFFIMIALFISIVGIVLIFIKDVQSNQKAIQKINSTYEKCLQQEVRGTDVASMINSAVNSNEKYHIAKDDDGNYVDDGNYSIRIFVKLQAGVNYYNMEKIYSNNIAEFVKNFNLENFKCTKIEYHDKSKRVAKVYFEIL